MPRELERIVRAYTSTAGPSAVSLASDGRVSPEDVQEARLAGLAPRQKRRRQRQLASAHLGKAGSEPLALKASGAIQEAVQVLLSSFGMARPQSHARSTRSWGVHGIHS